MKLIRQILIIFMIFLLSISNNICVNAETIKYYNNLNKLQKNIYKEMKKSFNKSKKSNVKLKIKGKMKDVLLSLEALSADCPYFFSGKLEINAEEYYAYSIIYISGLNNASTIEKIKKIANKIDVLGKDDYDTIKNIHDYLVNNIDYDYRADNTTVAKYSVLGALVQKKAVCEGYSKAFKYLCDLNDIPCVIVAGKGIDQYTNSSVNHMWNYVKLDDIWYAVDVTWDDSTYSKIRYDYFLSGKNTINYDILKFKDSHKANKYHFTFSYAEENIKGFKYPKLSPISYFAYNEIPQPKDQ